MQTTLAEDTKAKRNLWVLVAAQAILGSQLPVSFILGGLSGQVLATNKCFATLPISLIVFGSMISAPWLSSIMQKHGRRTGFVIGSCSATIGAILCAIALWQQSFSLFLLGSFLTGVYQSSAGFYRFAATDGASEAFRPKAISWVMAGGLIPAIAGPQLVKLTEDALAPIPFAGAYVAVIAINLVGIWIFAFLDSAKPTVAAIGSAPIRSRRQLLRTPAIAVAMVCAMVAYALMNLVMTSTPLSMKACGFTTAQASDVVSAHVLAMYAPSFFTGHLIVRFGVNKILASGLLILGLSGVAALSGIGLPNFYTALILLGIGWNFSFIAGTTLLAANHAPHERGRVQGMNDFAVFGLVTLASLSSGGLLNCSGSSPVEGWNLVNLAMIPFLALAGGTLAWFVWIYRALPKAG